MIDRRSFLRVGLGLIVAPTIVRASSLMAIKPLPEPIPGLREWIRSIVNSDKPEMDFMRRPSRLLVLLPDARAFEEVS